MRYNKFSYHFFLLYVFIITIWVGKCKAQIYKFQVFQVFFKNSPELRTVSCCPAALQLFITVLWFTLYPQMYILTIDTPVDKGILNRETCNDTDIDLGA
ncbi:hypothetical protein DWZ14_19670 [Enterocloster citroniae]|nr:hypothetical protein DWZ14_19670 [Enterocloster citroniae]